MGSKPDSSIQEQLSGVYPGAAFDAKWQQLVYPVDYINPTPDGRYNLIVIGAGPAGLITAIGSAGLGAKVALVERKAMGGDCLNVGCVPSKAILSAAIRFAGQTDAFTRAMAWLREVRAGIAHHDSVERYREQGVEVYLGGASLTADGCVEVHSGSGMQKLEATRIVLTTGSRAAMPPIAGLLEAAPLTNETVFDMTEQPASMVIIGAGAIGCELSQAFARLGIKVYLLDVAARILAGEEPEASEILQASSEALGIDIRVSVQIEKITTTGTIKTVHLQDGGSIDAEQILVAAGRAPNLERLNLEAAGVNYTSAGVEVDHKLRTSNKKILAAGDICSAQKLTHYADAQARIAIANALFLPTASRKGMQVPRCTYTTPEVAHLGMTKSQAERQGLKFQAWRVEWADMDRAKAENETVGFVEVLTKTGKDKIIGATIVGKQAGDLLAPLAVMQANNLGLASAGKALLPYPTRGEYLRRLADQYNRTRLTPLVANLMRRWLSWRR